MRCSTLRGTFCSLITLATPRQDWTGYNPNRREGGGCGFTLSRSHSCCAVRLIYTQISPGHIWTTLYIAHGTALCRKLPTQLCRRTRNPDRSWIDIHLIMRWFYENIRRSNFFFLIKHFDRKRDIDLLSTNVGISVWRLGGLRQISVQGMGKFSVRTLKKT